MARLIGRIHDSDEERRNITESNFKKGKVLPAFAVSCQDGILLLGVSSKPNVRKIKKLLDRVVCMSVGDTSDFISMYASMSAFAKVQAFVERSQGDMRIVDDLITRYSESLRMMFRDLYSNSYPECELIIAKLGFEPSDDNITSMAFDGSVTRAERFVVIPDVDSLKPQVVIDRLLTMHEAMKVLVDIVKQFRPDAPLFWQVVTLSRQAVREKSFDKVYIQLSNEEIEQWLKP